MMISEVSTNTNHAVTGIACDDSQVRIALVGCPDRPGVAAEIFGRLAAENISVDMIIQTLGKEEGTNVLPSPSARAISMARHARAGNRSEPHRRERHHGGYRNRESQHCGRRNIDQPGIAADMFAALASAQINIKMIATSEIKISCLVDKTQGHDAVRTIHRRFFPQAHAAETH